MLRIQFFVPTLVILFVTKFMSLHEQIQKDYIEAMKAREQLRLSTLRMLRSALKNKQIELKKDLSDEDVQAVVKSQAKQLKDSLQEFEKASRDDLALSTKAELEIIAAYLPKQMSDEELLAVVKKTLTKIGASSSEDMGKAMGAVMGAVQGGADGGRVKAMVTSELKQS